MKTFRTITIGGHTNGEIAELTVDDKTAVKIVSCIENGKFPTMKPPFKLPDDHPCQYMELYEYDDETETISLRPGP